MKGEGMKHYPKAIQDAITYFSQLPGIGTKTAERLVFFLLRKPAETQKGFVAALSAIHQGVQLCKECGYVSESQSEKCVFCADTHRQRSIVCVVPDIQTVQTIEKSNAFQGCYHVLGGVINPIEGVSADMLTISQLVDRVRTDRRIKEVILATGTDIEGEQTALYITKLLSGARITLTRLARGLPRGTNLEYTDELTLADAITNRTSI